MKKLTKLKGYKVQKG